MERLPALAAELVRLQVDCIVVRSTAVVQAAKDATQSIPIVVVVSADLVGTGLVASLARPGGNITGMSVIDPELAGKRLELFRDLLPTLSRVAFLAYGVIQPTGCSSRKRRTPPRDSAFRCSRW